MSALSLILGKFEYLSLYYIYHQLEALLDWDNKNLEALHKNFDETRFRSHKSELKNSS